MAATARQYVDVCLHPQHLVRTLTITALVGTWLTLYNQGHLLVAGEGSTALLGKVALNYLTPFVVSNWGLISREAGDE